MHCIGRLVKTHVIWSYKFRFDIGLHVDLLLGDWTKRITTFYVTKMNLFMEIEDFKFLGFMFMRFGENWGDLMIRCGLG